MAGFGTSGSLLAGAAVLFLLGSAIVAFRGWPQIATRPTTSDVAAAPVPLGSRASQRLIHALAATAPRVHAANVAGGSRLGKGAVRQRVDALSVTRGAPTGPTTPGAGSGSATAATASLPSSAGGCSACGHSGGSPGPAPTVTNKIVQTVSTVGTDVGQQLTGLSATLAHPVSAVNAPVGNTVGSVGSTAGGVVSGTSTTAANTLTTIGNALGGGH